MQGREQHNYLSSVDWTLIDVCYTTAGARLRFHWQGEADVGEKKEEGEEKKKNSPPNESVFDVLAHIS